MPDPASRVSVAASLKLLGGRRYRDLLLIAGILSIPKIILLLAGGTASAGSGQRITLSGLMDVASDCVVFPGCLLATLYLNRSVLLAEPVRLVKEFRRAARALITYFILNIIESAPLLVVLVAVEGITRILISVHALERGNLLFQRVALLFGAAIVRMVFLFSVPLLVYKSIGILENVRQSLKLFGRHTTSLLPILGFSLLVSGIGLPAVLRIVSRTEELLAADFVREIVLILFYVLSMDIYASREGTG
jgi:hypothetical protein